MDIKTENLKNFFLKSGNSWEEVEKELTVRRQPPCQIWTRPCCGRGTVDGGTESWSQTIPKWFLKTKKKGNKFLVSITFIIVNYEHVYFFSSFICQIQKSMHLSSVITSHCPVRRLPHCLWKLQPRPCCQLNSFHNSNLRQHVSVCWTLWLYCDFNTGRFFDMWIWVFDMNTAYLLHRSLDHRRRKLCIYQQCHYPHLKRKYICLLVC